MFKDTDFGWLHIIDCLKQTGMPIKEIKNFVDWCMEGDSTVDKRLDLIEQQQAVVLKQIQQMQDTLHMLNYKHWYYETAQEVGSNKLEEMIKNGDVPPEFHDILKKEKRI